MLPKIVLLMLSISIIGFSQPAWSQFGDVSLQCSSGRSACTQSHLISTQNENVRFDVLSSCGDCTVQANATDDFGIQLQIETLVTPSAYHYFYFHGSSENKDSVMAFTGTSQACEINFLQRKIQLAFQMTAKFSIQPIAVNSSMTLLCTDTQNVMSNCFPVHDCENFNFFDNVHRTTYKLVKSYFDLGGYTHPQLYRLYGKFEHRTALPFCPAHCTCSLHFQRMTAHCLQNKAVNTFLQYRDVVRAGYRIALDITSRKIVSIDEGAFQGLHVDRLLLGNNLLSKIEPNTFLGINVGLNSIELEYNNIEYLPSNVFYGLSRLVYLQLKGNRLSALHPNLLKQQFISLRWLDISFNNFTTLDPEIFNPLLFISSIVLNQNGLTTLQPGAFEARSTLFFVVLDNNELNHIKPGAFKGCTSLARLHLSGNNLTVLEPGIFDDLVGLRELILSRNRLTEVIFGTLQPLIGLFALDISNNEFKTLTPHMLSGLHHLKGLILSGNKLTSLESKTFATPASHLDFAKHDNFSELQFILSNDNKIQYIDKDFFRIMPSIEFVQIRDNPLLRIDASSFISLSNGTLILVDEPATCCFIGNATCSPTNEKAPYLTCQRLLPNIPLKIFMWIFALGALIGNTGVLIWRCVKHGSENIVQVLLIENLAASDLLMGIYMLIIASADTYYGQFFPSEAGVWRSGIICKLAGTLSVLSSEGSVFFITLISIDRYLAIKYPKGTQRLTKKSAIIVLSILWCLALLLSIIPTSLSGVDPNFYEASEVCIGLPFVRVNLFFNATVSQNFEFGDILSSNDLTDYTISSTKDFTYDSVYIYPESSSDPGQYFAIALFLGVNLLCFLTVAICYIMIFIIYKRVSNRAGKSKGNEDIILAVRMGVIVLTDFICWMPIIVIGILVQANLLNISPIVYVYIVVFVLPINSAVNPFLYTAATFVSEYRRRNAKERPKKLRRPQKPMANGDNSQAHMIESST